MKWTNRGHMFDDLGSLLADKRKLYIYGAAKYGRELAAVVDHCRGWLDWEIEFVDRNTDKRKNYCDGHPVISPDEFFAREAGGAMAVLCVNRNDRDQILACLKALKWRYLGDVFPFSAFMEKYLPIHCVYRHNKVFIPSLNIVPGTVCNLNCRGCLNFNPHIRRHVVYELDVLKADADAFFAAADVVYRFQITGGEPLLYPRLEELISYIGRNYRDRMVFFELVTNGTIIPSESLARLFRKHDMLIYLDDYRKTVKAAVDAYPRIRDALTRAGVNYWENLVETWFDLSPETADNSHLSEQELREHFDNCSCPYTTLVNRSLVSCNYAHYAAKAGIFPDHADNYYDLGRVAPDRKKELVEFRLRCNEKGYLEFCRKCLGFPYDQGHECHARPIPAAVQMPGAAP